MATLVFVTQRGIKVRCLKWVQNGTILRFIDTGKYCMEEFKSVHSAKGWLPPSLSRHASRSKTSLRNPMPKNELEQSQGEVSSDETSYFHLDIRVRHDEMAHWSQERLATFFEAVSVLMAAKTQSRIPARPSAQTGGHGAASANLDGLEQRLKKMEQSVAGVRRHVNTLHE